MTPDTKRWERFLPLVFLALAFVTLAPIFRHPTWFAGQYDWRYFLSWIDVGRRSVSWWHQVPLWNPYGCGGEVLLANPQSQVASPTFLLALVFGTAVGTKLGLVVYYACAFDGMYRLARDYKLTRVASALASVLFGAGGWLALHVSAGHVNFAAAALFPYLVLCYRRAARDRWVWCVPMGALAAWIAADGGTSTPALAAVLLATLAVTDAIELKSARPFAVLAGGAACAALLGAARILPAFEFALDHPRRQWETDSSTLLEMIRNGYWWKGLSPVNGKRYWFHEYGWRLAYVTPPFILWSLREKRTRAWWWVAAVGAGIVAGRAIPYGPWWLLKHLPIWRDLRVPSRYAVMFALAFPLLAAGGFDDLRARFAAWQAKRAWLTPALAALVVVAAAADGIAFEWVQFWKVFDFPIEPPPRTARFYQVKGSWMTMMQEVMQNHGALRCDEEAPLQRAAELDEGDVPQARLLDPSAGTIVALRRWTPNRVELDIDLARPTTVMLNQNWNEHWKSSAGRIAKVGEKWPHDTDGGRLGVEAPPGKYLLAVYYRPRSFVVGAVVSGIAWPVALVVLVLSARRRRRRDAES
jgi:hypothetical protein